MSGQNLRQHVLDTTSSLRSQLLQAVDRLESRGDRVPVTSVSSNTGTLMQYYSDSLCKVIIEH